MQEKIPITENMKKTKNKSQEVDFAISEYPKDTGYEDEEAEYEITPESFDVKKQAMPGCEMMIKTADEPGRQRDVWESQHHERKNEHEILKDKPNVFAEECLQYIPQNGIVLEIGSANGRDARYFARKKNIKVIAVDFSREALKQLKEASQKDNTSELVFAVIADANNLPFAEFANFDAIYSRSALHLSDEELKYFLEHAVKMLKPKGYLLIEGKTKDDFKISISEEVSSNLFIDNDGHLRRAWDEQAVDLFDQYGLDLISSRETEEIWHGNKTNFINFITQKV